MTEYATGAFTLAVSQTRLSLSFYSHLLRLRCFFHDTIAERRFRVFESSRPLSAREV